MVMKAKINAAIPSGSKRDDASARPASSKLRKSDKLISVRPESHLMKKPRGENQLGSSLLFICKDPAVPSGDNDHCVGVYAEKSSLGSSTKREVNAALGLMKLSNDVWPVNGSHSYQIKKRKEGSSSSKTKIKLKIGGKGKFVESNEETGSRDEMKDEDDWLLHVPLAKADYATKKKKTKKMKDSISSDTSKVEHKPIKHIRILLKSPEVPKELLSAASDKPEEDAESLSSSSERGNVDGGAEFPLHVASEFSFSVVRLLIAVRAAMISHQKIDINRINKFSSSGSNYIKGAKSKHLLPSTLDNIVEHVRSKPLDPSILQTREPLTNLVSGVLKIFSSKTAPLQAKNWKPLVYYSRPSKLWSWIGPVTPNSTEKLLSSQDWGLPHGMLDKLVHCFSTWLKNCREILHQVRKLPPPPPALTQQASLDPRSRAKVIISRKCISTISPSSTEVRAHFRREEAARYLIPDWSFSYTTIDNKKSTVSPLRRWSGKSSYRKRDHVMLKADRPPYVNVCCLVRDAAARLPRRIGTRVDVCTLVRDSQYLIEKISEEQLNATVSSALDRLQCESDPCVRYDGVTKKWVYLHGERGEEDFEDVGTSTTRKRQKV